MTGGPAQTHVPGGNIPITDTEFAQFRKLIFDIAGISLSDAKKILLAGRLSKRLRALGFTSFAQYFKHVTGGRDDGERQTMVDLLTTNETYFFREPKHFDFLREFASGRRQGPSFRVLSAASSSGEEAYSIAMVLAETLGNASWDVVGTDISTQMVEKAKRGIYSLEGRIGGISTEMLKKYCLKGVDEYDGSLLISRQLRDRVQFLYGNLMEPRHSLGTFDVIFLRNVMIYFDTDIKKKVVANLLPCLKKDGCFIVGHSESLNGLTEELVPIRPTIYCRRGQP